ncbi:hypothetical protein ASF06_18175 [Agreia sp. Leaf244]|nr:hypothetical protein ASF06_18175 [Agreia sp. Leaf244]
MIERLQAFGVTVKTVANPLRGLTFDGEYVKSVVSQTEGDVVLVGHSYGGPVVTYAGSGQPNVKAVVFVSAFGIDKGETAGASAEDYPKPALADALQPWTYPGSETAEVSIREEEYHRVFAADLPEASAAVQAANQRPLSRLGLSEPLTVEPAWKAVPTWWIFGTEDKVINPDYQRDKSRKFGSTVTEVEGGSHATLISHADEVADVILAAVSAVRQP